MSTLRERLEGEADCMDHEDGQPELAADIREALTLLERARKEGHILHNYDVYKGHGSLKRKCYPDCLACALDEALGDET